MRVRRLLVTLSVLSLLAAPAFGQFPGLTAPPATPASTSATPHSNVPPDPLGRETPRGTILGFLKAAQDERYAVATQYFQPIVNRRRRVQVADDEIAAQLLIIFNQKLAGALDLASRDPQGRLDDGLPPDEELVSSSVGLNEKFPILLVRQEDEEGSKLWYFSRESLEHVPEIYDSLTFPELEKKIPESLVTNRLLSMPIWQWIALILCIPIALLVGRLVTLLSVFLINRWRRAGGKSQLVPGRFFAADPISLTIAILLHYSFVSYIGTSLIYRLYYRHIVWIFLAISFYWIVTRVTRAISAKIGASLTTRGKLAERSIVSLVRRFTEITVFLMVGLLILRNLGVDVSTALAGVGIGGLALGLGAQKTFENMFGGVTVLFDKVIQIGDVCRINNQTGVVEDIGLRSTRLRTPERTLIAIPNGTMATATLENLRFRDKFLCQQMIRLRYDLSPDHLRYVLGRIEDVLKKDSKVEDATARVRFVRFAEYALEVEIFCYILEPDYASYLATQEELFLKIMDEIEKAGAVVALPTQTTFVTQDSWIDPQKAKAAQAAVGKARDAGVPGVSQPADRK